MKIFTKEIFSASWGGGNQLEKTASELYKKLRKIDLSELYSEFKINRYYAKQLDYKIYLAVMLAADLYWELSFFEKLFLANSMMEISFRRIYKINHFAIGSKYEAVYNMSFKHRSNHEYPPIDTPSLHTGMKSDFKFKLSKVMISRKEYDLFSRSFSHREFICFFKNIGYNPSWKYIFAKKLEEYAKNAHIYLRIIEFLAAYEGKNWFLLYQALENLFSQALIIFGNSYGLKLYYADLLKYFYDALESKDGVDNEITLKIPKHFDCKEQIEELERLYNNALYTEVEIQDDLSADEIRYLYSIFVKRLPADLPWESLAGMVLFEIADRDETPPIDVLEGIFDNFVGPEQAMICLSEDIPDYLFQKCLQCSNEDVIEHISFLDKVSIEQCKIFLKRPLCKGTRDAIRRAIKEKIKKEQNMNNND